MPSVKSSARPNLRGWQLTQNIPAGGEKRAAPAEPDPTARSPFMRASMPLMASTGDAFQRQFYTQNGLPQQRILPAKSKGGASA